MYYLGGGSDTQFPLGTVKGLENLKVKLLLCWFYLSQIEDTLLLQFPFTEPLDSDLFICIYRYIDRYLV